MSDSVLASFPSRPSLEQLRKQAKELLKQVRAGDQPALSRLATAGLKTPPRSLTLADAQLLLARERGFESWASLKRHFDASNPSRIAPFERFSDDLLRALGGDAGALEQVHVFLGHSPSVDQLRAQILERMGSGTGGSAAEAAMTPEESRRFVARLYGFDGWREFEASVSRPAARSAPSRHGLSDSPPFYRIDRKEGSVEPRPPLSDGDWEVIFEVMREQDLTELRTSQMADSVLERVVKLEFVRSLHLEGSRRVTDVGLAHLANMPWLERLNPTGCSISDDGLRVLRQLPELRMFSLFHHQGVSDAGLANLRFCDRLERVDLLGSNSGDGVIQALAGKPRLRHFKSGNGVTDDGVVLLRRFPVFKSWHGGEPAVSLMSFQADPNYLLLRGPITDHGLKGLQGLDGLFALNLEFGKLHFSAEAVKSLGALPHLEWLGLDATDETLGAVATLPHLRMLMCQDTTASDAGFRALSESRTLEYLWGRRCYGLTGKGFRSLSRMPALRGLSVSCRNVADGALAALPQFPSLVEFMPMDFTDEGFRHLGQCERLETLWCMYCRETGDAATGHLVGLRHLRSYYAGQTQVTDRSLELLSRIQSLEKVMLSACRGVTNAGVKLLAALPRLRELSLDHLPGVTRGTLASLPDHVQVNFES